MFVWGIVNYQPHHFTVYRADTMQDDSLQNYRINIANKLYRPTRFSVSVEGLDSDSYELSAKSLTMPGTGRTDIKLHISDNLSKGLHPFLVHIQADDGWQDSFRVQHFASGG
jgi:hypothetical protein